MYCLTVIKAMNANRMPKREDNFNRHCSYHQNKDGSIILHSAQRRSTGWLDPVTARVFLTAWEFKPKTAQRDALVESYFS